MRRRCSISLSVLARRTGLHEGFLGRLERKGQNPTVDTLQRIADALDEPVADFFPSHAHKAEAYDLAPTLFDGKTIPPDKLKKAQKLVEAVLALEDICQAPKHAEIPLYLPLKPDESGIADLAQKVRDYMQIRAGIVLDYFELMESFGFRVLVMPMVKLSKHDTPVVQPDNHDAPMAQSNKRKYDAFCFHDRRHENAFFVIRKQDNAERQIFQLFYELGLLFLYNYCRRTGHSMEPAQARTLSRKFSAFFLMPKAPVTTTVAQLGAFGPRWSYDLLLRVKTRFGVSAQAFLYRLKELGLIDEPTTKSLEEKIKKHYDATRNAEPGVARLPLSENGRLLDLFHQARGIDKGKKRTSKDGQDAADDVKDELERIKSVLKEYKIWKE